MEIIHITSTYILLAKANHMVSPDFSKEGMTNSSTRGKKKNTVGGENKSIWWTPVQSMTEVNGEFISWIGKLPVPKRKEKELCWRQTSIQEYLEPKNIKVRTLTSRKTTSGGSSCLFCYFVRKINTKQIKGLGEIRNRVPMGMRREKRSWGNPVLERRHHFLQLQAAPAKDCVQAECEC